jgi:hypothetical protein
MNVYRHKWVITMMLMPVALSYPHEPNLPRQARAATRKSVATYHIVVAITYFLATFCFLWQ